MTGSKPDIFHTPLLTPFASRLIHICVDLREIRTSDAHPKIPQNPCGRRDTEACTHLRGQPQNPQEGRAACTKQSLQSPDMHQKDPALTAVSAGSFFISPCRLRKIPLHSIPASKSFFPARCICLKPVYCHFHCPKLLVLHLIPDPPRHALQTGPAAQGAPPLERSTSFLVDYFQFCVILELNRHFSQENATKTLIVWRKQI